MLYCHILTSLFSQRVGGNPFFRPPLCFIKEQKPKIWFLVALSHQAWLYKGICSVKYGSDLSCIKQIRCFHNLICVKSVEEKKKPRNIFLSPFPHNILIVTSSSNPMQDVRCMGISILNNFWAIIDVNELCVWLKNRSSKHQCLVPFPDKHIWSLQTRLK